MRNPRTTIITLTMIGVAVLAASCVNATKPETIAAATKNSTARSDQPAVSPTPTVTISPSPTGISRAASSAPTRQAPSLTPPRPVTAQVVIRPVTAAGHAAPGFRVEPMGDQALCNEPSSAAVDNDIRFCSPGALDGQACWPEAGSNTTLCYADPTTNLLRRYSLSAPMAPVQHPGRPFPLGLTLADGTRCSLRDGGAWSALDGHPKLYGTYQCTGDQAVWGGQDQDGTDRRAELWTVQVAPMSGHGALRTLAVSTAYFVGNAQ